MVHLTHLYLQRNQITRIENLENLKNLKKLYLGYNRIHRLENICSLHRLEELHLECQRFSGDFSFDGDTLTELAVGPKRIVILGFSSNKCIHISIEFIVFEKKSVKIMNVSGLRLRNLSFLAGFSCLELLIATDNSFEDTDAITPYVSNILTINQADLRRCPAQHDFYYRNKISSRCDSLRNWIL